MMFFWVIVTCHAAWSECEYSAQPSMDACMDQALQINQNTDAIAICTAKSENRVTAPDDWAIQIEARK